MSTAESGSISDLDSARVTSSEAVEVPADLWGDLRCPLRGPKFPFKSATRDVFRRYFKNQLNSEQEMFNSYFEGSDNERLRAEKYLRDHLPEVVARDAWGEALQRANKESILPFILPLILCIVMPWLVASHSLGYNILVALAGVIGVTALGFIVLWVILAPLEGGWLDSTTGGFIVVALCAGAVAWLYEQRSTGWVFLSVIAAALGLFFATYLVQDIATDLTIALLNRITIARYFQAELSAVFLEILSSLSKEPPENAQAAKNAYYAAELIERHWRKLLAGQTFHPAIQQRVRTTIRGIAAGMREIGVYLTFPTKIASSEESFESKMIRIMAKQLTALAASRYGDLIVAEAPEVAIQPRLWEVVRGIRSVIAAIAPITLLFVIPRVFNIAISENLNGTLLTVSLGWLALYIVGWLDPKGLANVSKLPDITNVFGSQKRGD
jgi:hypothetical protein